MSKLPGEVCLQIARVTTRDVWDMNELLHVIKGEVWACELSDTVKIHDRRGQEAPTRRTVPTYSNLLSYNICYTRFSTFIVEQITILHHVIN